jgi:translation elongation factor P/translation initiation factor 5A
MPKASELKRGMIIEINEAPHAVKKLIQGNHSAHFFDFHHGSVF